MVSATEPVLRVLAALQAAGCDPVESGAGWEARCPAHDDDRRSFSLGTGDDGKAVVNCHAGCDTEAAVRRLGLTMADLFMPRSGALPRPAAPARSNVVRLAAPKLPAKPKAKLGPVVAKYPYVDEAGELLFEVLRHEPKTFRQRRPDGQGGWSWKVKGVRQVPFQLPKVLEAVRGGATVWVVEGEKDALNLGRLGLVATCNAGGASKNPEKPKWLAAHAAPLVGAASVVVIADKDEAGRAHAKAVASSLHLHVQDLRVVEVPGDAKDASDWLAAGAGEKELLELAAAAPRWAPAPANDDLAPPAPPRSRDERLEHLPAELQAGSGATPPEPPHTATDPKAEPPGELELAALRLTDLGNSERLVERHGQDLRFVHRFDAWFIWDGKRWCRDSKSEVAERAKLTVRGIPEEVKRLKEPVKGNTKDEERHRRQALAIRRWALASEAAARLRALVQLAESSPALAALPGDFDSDPWALNLQNGTLDLRTRQLRPHRREDMLSKVLPITYDEAATCPRWEKFVQEIFLGDQELVAFVRRAIGYSLTGSDREQVFFIAFGTGANGKGRLFNVLNRLLGGPTPDAAPEEGYALSSDISTFSAGNYDATGDKPRPDLVRLKGARLVTASEQNEEVRLNEALLKQLTGGDPLTARDLHSKPITFRPVMKLWIAVNHRPKAAESGHGFWRRVRLLPFRYTVPEVAKDPDLDEKLLKEASGILNWMLAGLADWQENGLGTAKAITEATDAYRGEMDVVGRFLGEECVEHPDAKVPAAALYAAYERWCKANGERPFSSNKFGRRITDRGFRLGQDGEREVRLRFGLGLLAKAEAPDGSNASDGNASGGNSSGSNSGDLSRHSASARTHRTHFFEKEQEKKEEASLVAHHAPTQQPEQQPSSPISEESAESAPNASGGEVFEP